MSTTINASTSSGLVQTADTSGVLVLQSNGTSAAGVSGSNFQCDSGYGSVATVYGCRAWVNFDGTKNVTNTGASTNGQPVYIRASGNVTSVIKNGTGDYTVNFTVAMPDANYAAVFGSAKESASTGGFACINDATAPSTTALRVLTVATGATSTVITDKAYVHVSIFR